MIPQEDKDIIPEEELERIKKECKEALLEEFAKGVNSRFSWEDGYLVRAKAEYLRFHSSQPSGQGATGMRWVKAAERLPKTKKEVFIRYDDNFCQKEVGSRDVVRDLLENGWLNVEWFDEGLTGNTTHNG